MKLTPQQLRQEAEVESYQIFHKNIRTALVPTLTLCSRTAGGCVWSVEARSASSSKLIKFNFIRM